MIVSVRERRVAQVGGVVPGSHDLSAAAPTRLRRRLRNALAEVRHVRGETLSAIAASAEVWSDGGPTVARRWDY